MTMSPLSLGVPLFVSDAQFSLQQVRSITDLLICRAQLFLESPTIREFAQWPYKKPNASDAMHARSLVGPEGFWDEAEQGIRLWALGGRRFQAASFY